ncbi:MAG TPA: glycoside hydrolase family 3 protein [Polyangiaceae bacterium]|nr:glycoside hydrolase family 3 protein [Polyangiaceae bacterium]
MRTTFSISGRTLCGSALSALWLLAACGSSGEDAPTMQPAGNSGSTGLPSGGTGGTVQGGGGTAGTVAGGGTAGDVGVVGGAGGAGTAGTGGAPTAGAGGAAGGSAGTGGGSGFMVPTVAWPSAECVTLAQTTLAGMSTRQKAAQMVMAPNPGNADVSGQEVGAVFAPGGAVPPGGSGVQSWATMIDGYIGAAASTELAIPILYGLDGVHGNNTATGTVIFPHNAGLGSTRNPALVEQVGQIAAKEIRATGANWTFGPMVSVSFDDRWGRVYESFSEDPAITAELSAAMVLGLQGRGGVGSGQPGVIACAKHWAGDGQATAGTSGKGAVVDRGDVQIDEAAMRAYGIAPYLPAIQAGLGSVMVSDATWNGENMTGHSQLMNDILKVELGFKGFISTDWQAATESVDSPGFVAAAEAGVDMFMQPNGWQGTIDALETGLSAARLDDAVTRLLQTKCQAGLFTNAARDPALIASVGSAEHRMVGRQAVRESLVLAQNTGNVLPLAKTAGTVWVGGSGADDIGRQCGGWTISWQGNSGNTTTGTTISAAINSVAPLAATMDAASVVVVVLSEAPYAEFEGDSQSIDTLPPDDFALLAQAKAAGKQVVAIVMSGRPVLITDQLANADAWVIAWLPGTEGDGVADVLFGGFAPTGKLSHSWPASADQVNVNVGDPGYAPLFMLGHGLTY